MQKTLLYLGELNDSQHAGWCRTIDATVVNVQTQLALFPSDRTPPPGLPAVQIRMDQLLLHRLWFDQSAMADLLDEDFGVVAKDALCGHLKERWSDLFGAKFEILRCDLTSTYFECDAPQGEHGGLRRHGYSRDKRPDCVQVVIALIVTPDGFPLAYEVMKGNTADNTTLSDFLATIEQQYGTRPPTPIPADVVKPQTEKPRNSELKGHSNPPVAKVGLASPHLRLHRTKLPCAATSPV